MSTITTVQSRQQPVCPPGIDPVRWARAPWYARDKFFVAQQKKLQEAAKVEAERLGGRELSRREEDALELRRVVTQLRKNNPQWSAARIARETGRSQTTVARHLKASLAEQALERVLGQALEQVG